MKVYRPLSLVLMLLFAATGMLFLCFPDNVLALFNTISSGLGMALSPLTGFGFYLILAVGYMYMVAILAFLMFRHPENRSFSLLLINAGYFLWWGGWSFGPRHLIPMLLFLAIPLVVVPRRMLPLVIILAVISIAQMLIPLAGSMLAPDTYFMQNAHLPFFGYSSIWSYSWQQLLEGAFANNLGSKLFGLRGWTTLLPIILAILAVTAIFVITERRSHHNDLPQVR